MFVSPNLQQMLTIFRDKTANSDMTKIIKTSIGPSRLNLNTIYTAVILNKILLRKYRVDETNDTLN